MSYDEKRYLARAEVFPNNRPMLSFWLMNDGEDRSIWVEDDRNTVMNQLTSRQVVKAVSLVSRDSTVKDVVLSMINRADNRPDKLRGGTIEFFFRDYASLTLVAHVKVSYILGGANDQLVTFSIQGPVDSLPLPKMSEVEMGKHLLTISEEQAEVMSNEELASLAEGLRVMFVARIHPVFIEIAKRLRKDQSQFGSSN
jgi:hypothetical protein